MTEKEQKEIIRVCGPNYLKTDIPTYIRNREKAEEEDRLTEEIRDDHMMADVMDQEREEALKSGELE